MHDISEETPELKINYILNVGLSSWVYCLFEEKSQVLTYKNT